MTDQLSQLGVSDANIIVEPTARNTGPAVAAASFFCKARNIGDIILVTPSDHFIEDTISFHTSINNGLELMDSKKIVTFGIEPDKPETGYGYLELNDETQEVSDLKSFTEKPSLELAEKMIEQKNSYGTQVCFFLDRGYAFRPPHSFSKHRKIFKISVDRVFRI